MVTVRPTDRTYREFLKFKNDRVFSGKTFKIVVNYSAKFEIFSMKLIKS